MVVLSWGKEGPIDSLKGHVFPLFDHEKGDGTKGGLQNMLSHICNMNRIQNYFRHDPGLKWFQHDSSVFCEGAQDTVNCGLVHGYCISTVHKSQPYGQTSVKGGWDWVNVDLMQGTGNKDQEGPSEPYDSMIHLQN